MGGWGPSLSAAGEGGGRRSRSQGVAALIEFCGLAGAIVAKSVALSPESEQLPAAPPGLRSMLVGISSLCIRSH